MMGYDQKSSFGTRAQQEAENELEAVVHNRADVLQCEGVRRASISKDVQLNDISSVECTLVKMKETNS
jgi:hypothetical protein